MTRDTAYDPFDADLDAFLAASPVDRETLLRQAWSQSSGDGGADAFLRESLAAHARDDAALAVPLRELEDRDRTQLDLHLQGGREATHETSAPLLGQFLIRLNESVKAIAKSVAGVGRLVGDLSVAAPAPGSVRIILLEDRSMVGGNATRSDARDAWATGIEHLAMTFGQAEADAEGLGGAVSSLRPPARHALRLLAQTIEGASWTLEGSLVDRRGGVQHIRLGTAAATRLKNTAGLGVERSWDERVLGTVDGWRWSTATLRFKPAGGGAAVVAFVPEALRPAVAHFNGRPTRRVEALFHVDEQFAPRSTGMRLTYTLRALEDQPDLFDLTS